MITMFARPQRRFSNLRCNSNAGPPCLHPLARSGHERSASSDSFFVERCRPCRWTQGERQTVERKEAEERCDGERRRRAAEQRQRREERRKGGAPLLTCACLAHGEMEGWKDERRLSGLGQRKAKSDASLQRWGVDHRVVVRRPPTPGRPSVHPLRAASPRRSTRGRPPPPPGAHFHARRCRARDRESRSSGCSK